MKNKIWKALILGTILIASTQQSFGQIGKSRNDIIKELEYDYEPGTTDDGMKYISYGEEFTTEKSGTYTRYKFIYFFTNDDGTETCHFWMILEPSSEINSWVSYFNKELVKIEYMKWKDYETNILYTLDIEDGVCITTAKYDLNKQ